jgi:two-component system, OmpR family, alkaline phosphatase synthesis response regulator PhoP
MLKPNQRILIVEDDPDIVRVVQTYLERAGYQVEVALDGLTGLTIALETPPELIVLDWMLPGLDGLEFIERLRREQRTPIIMLTARTEEHDRILGLDFGADDYVSKPFSPRELVARVKVVLRRSETLDSQEPLRLGPLTIDPARRSVTRDGTSIELTALEFDLLYTLASQPGRVFRRGELLDRVWGTDFEGVDRVVDVHISNLRQRLETDPSQPKLILTVRGVGYKFAGEMT